MSLEKTNLGELCDLLNFTTNEMMNLSLIKDMCVDVCTCMCLYMSSAFYINLLILEVCFFMCGCGMISCTMLRIDRTSEVIYISSIAAHIFGTFIALFRHQHEVAQGFREAKKAQFMFYFRTVRSKEATVVCVLCYFSST